MRVDSVWVSQYPIWDIEFESGRWCVKNKHAVLAREFTTACQRYPTLRSQRPGYDLENPDHWYFVDLRRADNGVVAEVVKYIAKGSEIIEGGAGAVVDFLKAIKGRRMMQTFGSLYNVDLEEDESDEEFDASAKGECPYEDCPAPSVHEWEFVNFGPGDWVLDWDSRTGSYRVVGSARDGPG